MALPANPPATTTPAAYKTWAQNVVDTVVDHDARLLVIDGGTAAGSNAGSLLYLHANYR